MNASDRLELMLANTSEPILDASAIAFLLQRCQLPDSAGLYPVIHSVEDGVMANSAHLTSVSADFTVSLEGWPIEVDGADSGDVLSTSIQTYLSQTEVILADTGTTTGSEFRYWSPYYVPTYDLNLGASIGWRLKASAVAAGYDFMVEQKQFSRSQMFRNFMELSKEYAKKARPSSLRLKRSSFNRVYVLGQDRVYVQPASFGAVSAGELLEDLESGA